MHSIWNFFLERRAFTILTMVTLLVVGFFSVLVIPKEATPEIKAPIGFVVTVLPGASAADVERLVTDKLEDDIKNINNIDKVTSSSQAGVSLITANFIASADIDKSIQDLRTAVDRAKAELPAEAKEPSVTEMNFADQPMLVLSISTDITPTALADIGKSVKEDLERVSGVSKVNIAGARDHEASVILSKDALVRNNLRVEQVIGALSGANAALPSGEIEIDDVSYPVQFQGDLKSVDDLPNVPINTPTGAVPLRDIATIVDGFEKPITTSRLSADIQSAPGKIDNALTLSIHKRSGGNIVTFTEELRDRIEELKKTTLKGADVVIMFDQGEEVKKELRSLSKTGLETVILVMIVLMITIGTREALIAALSIPLSFVIAFIGLYATGNTINNVSLFSLILSIGILVDSGIVVVEAIHTRRERGMDQITAAKEAIREYAWPLIAGTMTTIVFFFPLYFLSGIMGKFVASIPFTIITVLLASIFVALGNVPILTLMFGQKDHGTSPITKYREMLWHKIDLWYRNLLHTILNSKAYKRLFFGSLIAFFLLAFTLPVVGYVKFIFFPPADTDFIYADIELPQASTLIQTDRATAEVEKIIAQNKYAVSFVTTIGQTSVFNATGAATNPKYANITINLRKDRKKDHTDNSEVIADQLRDAVHGVTSGTVTIMTPQGGPPSGAPIVVKVKGNDLDKLSLATAKLEAALKATPGARDVSSSLSNDATEIDLSVDRAKAAEYGLTSSNIAMTLRAAISGIEATEIRTNGTDIDVRVTLDLNSQFVNPEDTTRTDVDAIRAIPLATARGVVNVGSLLSASAGRNIAVITHEQGVRQMILGAYVDKNANAIEVTNAFRAKAANLDLGPDVSVSYGGDDEEIKRSMSEMGIALLAGLALALALLVLEFNEFRSTLRLIFIVPISIAGVLVGLALMGQPISFTSLLGMIALGGIIINHGILLLDTMARMRRGGDHGDNEHIVIDAAAERLRPIILTTITTVIGMIPLTMVNEFWAPLAWSVAFGLMFATVLTLIYIPVLSYGHMMKVAAKQAKKKSA
jgi:multidrug efflux pump